MRFLFILNGVKIDMNLIYLLLLLLLFSIPVLDKLYQKYNDFKGKREFNKRQERYKRMI